MESNICPKTWMVESILVTICCCLPLGIVGIVNASKVSSLFVAGDFEGAQRASEEAAKWTKIGFFTGLVLLVLYIVLYSLVLSAFLKEL